MTAPQPSSPKRSDPSEALAWLEVLSGPVHRLAWLGATPERTRAWEAFTRRLEVLYAAGGAHREIAVLGSTWAMLAMDEDPLGVAWQCDDLLADPVGPTLRALLDLRGELHALKTLWRPVRFARARDELAELVNVQPNLRVSPAPDLLNEAREDVHALLRASEDPSAPPPEGLRLVDGDVEEWASEPRGTHQLLTGVKVWNSLVEWLARYQRLCLELVEAWTADPIPDSPLPDALDLAMAFPAAPRLAGAWLADLDLSRDPAADPEGFTPAATLDALTPLAMKRDPSDRTPLLTLVDELRAADPSLPEPAWAAEARVDLAQLADRTATLRRRAKARLKVTNDEDAAAQLRDVMASLEEAEAKLAIHESRDAREWVSLATTTLDQAVADQELAQHEARTAELFTRLQRAEALPDGLDELPSADIDDPSALTDTLARLEEAWAEAVDHARARLADLGPSLELLHGERDRDLGRDGAHIARQALQAHDLRRAHRALHQLEDLVSGASAALEERLDPGLKQLLHRGRRVDWPLRERHAFEAALARVRDRADVGLPAASQRAALGRLVEAVEADDLTGLTLLAVGTETQGLQPVLYWDSAVIVAPERFEDALPGVSGAVAGKLYLVEHDDGWTWEKLGARRDRYVPVVRTTEAPSEAETVPKHLRSWTGRLFLESADRVHGPYRVHAGHLAPFDARGLLGEMPARDFWDLFGGVHVPGLLTNERHVVDAPSLSEMVTEGGRLLDRLDDERASHWLAGLLEGLDGLSVPDLARAIERLESMDLPEDVLAQRLGRLSTVLQQARALSEAKAEAVRAWLDTDDGAEAITAAARQLVHERADLLDAAVVTERARLDAELAETREALTRARNQLAQLQQEVDAATSIADDARFALLARWGLAGAPAAGPAPSAPSVPTAPRAAEVLAPVTSLAALADDTAQALGHDRDEVANLLLTLSTSWWTLLAGPPGVGKSTWIRRFLHRLGHGPDSGRYLELVVRRDWQDDAPLFGFWHPGHHRWEASSEGLAERLLAAAQAWDDGHAGLYGVVLEEMNLASPEYYLARPISALEDATPTIRLYGADLAPANAASYPASFPVHPNVRWMGTVNVDDTVERISPRFLSRAAVLQVEPSVDQLLTATEPPWPERRPASWRDVLSLASGKPEVGLGALEDVIRLLHDEDVPGAPTPRALQGIRRYLAAADSVLDPAVAADFQATQRLLPSLRGVGARYRDVFDRLADLLDARQLPKAAARVRALRQRGEELGDFYDAFHG